MGSATSSRRRTSSARGASISPICRSNTSAWLMRSLYDSSSSSHQGSPTNGCRATSLHSCVVMVPS